MMMNMATIAMVETELKRAVMIMRKTVFLLLILLPSSVVLLRVSLEREEASYAARGSIKQKTYASTNICAE